MWRIVNIIFQLTATVLFIITFERAQAEHFLAWFVPLLLIILVIVNTFWFTRFISWVIFSIAFFQFLVLLSAFTLRWRLEPGFDSTPFYQAIIMYVSFVYVGLAQLKLLGSRKDAISAQTEMTK